MWLHPTGTTILLNRPVYVPRQPAAMLVKGRRLIDIPSTVVFTPYIFTQLCNAVLLEQGRPSARNVPSIRPTSDALHAPSSSLFLPLSFLRAHVCHQHFRLSLVHHVTKDDSSFHAGNLSHPDESSKRIPLIGPGIFQMTLLLSRDRFKIRSRCGDEFWMFLK